MLGRFIPVKHYADLLKKGRNETAPWLEFEPEILSNCYNRKPFLMQHRLTEHPAFSLTRLFELCKRLPSKQVLYRVGPIPDDAALDTSYDHYKNSLTLSEVLEHFEENQAYVCINNPERDSEFEPLIEELIGEVAANTNRMDPQISWYSTYIFISAQGSVTPYHMDREMNFLLQLRGTKTVPLWDPADNQIMNAEQKDFLLSHVGGRPPYQASFESKAMTFALRPGLGLHHPFIAPHRVYTGGELSVSLALTFRTRQSDMWTDAHRFNSRMRRLGMNPGPVGRRPLVDLAKCELARIGQRAHRLLATANTHTN